MAPIDTIGPFSVLTEDLSARYLSLCMETGFSQMLSPIKWHARIGIYSYQQILVSLPCIMQISLQASPSIAENKDFKHLGTSIC